MSGAGSPGGKIPQEFLLDQSSALDPLVCASRCSCQSCLPRVHARPSRGSCLSWPAPNPSSCALKHVSGLGKEIPKSTTSPVPRPSFHTHHRVQWPGLACLQLQYLLVLVTATAWSGRPLRPLPGPSSDPTLAHSGGCYGLAQPLPRPDSYLYWQVLRPDMARTQTQLSLVLMV